jgi:hypothetical protein
MNISQIIGIGLIATVFSAPPLLANFKPLTNSSKSIIWEDEKTPPPQIDIIGILKYYTPTSPSSVWLHDGPKPFQFTENKYDVNVLENQVFCKIFNDDLDSTKYYSSNPSIDVSTFYLFSHSDSLCDTTRNSINTEWAKAANNIPIRLMNQFQIDGEEFVFSNLITGRRFNTYDLNNDGRLEIVSTNYPSDNLKVWSLDSNLQYFDNTAFYNLSNQKANVINFAHIDENLTPDLINLFFDRSTDQGSDIIIKNISSNSLPSILKIDSSTYINSSISFTDINKNGKNDYFFTRMWTNFMLEAKGSDVYFDGIQSNFFKDKAKLTSMSSSIADLNNDNIPDIIESSYGSGTNPEYQSTSKIYFNSANQIPNSEFGKNINIPTAFTNFMVTFDFGANPRDYNNDGFIDLYQMILHGNTPTLECKYVGCANSALYKTTHSSFWKNNAGSLVHKTLGSPFYQNADLYNISSSWGDLNLDGYADLISTHAKTLNLIEVYLNNNGQSMKKYSLGSNSPFNNNNGHGMQYEQILLADYDNDGDEDLIFNDEFSNLWIFEHKGIPKNNWIKIDLIGDGKKVTRDVWGAKINVISGALNQFQEVYSGNGNNILQKPHAMIFGLAQNTNADIVIQWPDSSNSTSTFSGISSNECYKIIYANKSIQKCSETLNIVNNVLSFEDSTSWSTSINHKFTSLSSDLNQSLTLMNMNNDWNTLYTQKEFSLKVDSNYLNTNLLIDIRNNKICLDYCGNLQVSFSDPLSNLYNIWLGQWELTNIPSDTFKTYSFPIPQNLLPLIQNAKSNQLQLTWSTNRSNMELTIDNIRTTKAKLPQLGSVNCAAVSQWKSGAKYSANGFVLSGNSLYQCKTWPYTTWCSQDAYEPSGLFGTQAWKSIGTCN